MSRLEHLWANGAVQDAQAWHGTDGSSFSHRGLERRGPGAMSIEILAQVIIMFNHMHVYLRESTISYHYSIHRKHKIYNIKDIASYDIIYMTQYDIR